MFQRIWGAVGRFYDWLIVYIPAIGTIIEYIAGIIREVWYRLVDLWPGTYVAEGDDIALPEFEEMSKYEIDMWAEANGIILDRRKSKDKMIDDLFNALEARAFHNNDPQ